MITIGLTLTLTLTLTQYDHYRSEKLLAEDVLLYHDINEDGEVSKGEFSRNFAAWAVNQHEVRQEKPVYWGAPGGEGDGNDDQDDGEDDL